jgi:hypothetical protein
MSKTPTTEVLASDEARKRLPAMLRVFRREGRTAPHFVIGRHRRPEAVVLPFALYEDLVQQQDRSQSPDLFRLVHRQRQEIQRLAERRGARNVRLFGSVARGEAGPDSDVDFLVAMDKGRSLLDVVGFWQDLEELLGVKVDVLTEGGVDPLLHDRIEAEAVPL